jgi:hypothetical protein
MDNVQNCDSYINTPTSQTHIPKKKINKKSSLLRPKGHHKSPSLVRTLSLMNPVHVLPRYVSNILFNIIHQHKSTIPSCVVSLDFVTKRIFLISSIHATCMHVMIYWQHWYGKSVLHVLSRYMCPTSADIAKTIPECLLGCKWNQFQVSSLLNNIRLMCPTVTALQTRIKLYNY